MQPDHRTQDCVKVLQPSDVAMLERLRALETASEPECVLTLAVLNLEANEALDRGYREYSG